MWIVAIPALYMLASLILNKPAGKHGAVAELVAEDKDSHRSHLISEAQRVPHEIVWELRQSTSAINKSE